MHLRQRLLSVAAVAVMAAAVFWGSTLGTGEAREAESVLPWSGQKETIYFWYSDDTLTNFLNSAAVAFGEREGVRVLPVLTSESEYLEAVNRASIASEQLPDVWLVSHDSLEKAYLAGLAAPIQDAAGVCNENNFPGAALAAATYQDKLVGYPFSFEVSALAYNQTYLEEWAAQTALKELLNAGEEEVDPERNPDGIPVDETLLAQKTEEYIARSVPAVVEDIRTIADTFDVPPEVEGVMKWDVTDIFYNYWFVGNYMIVGGENGDDPDRVDIDNPETIQCLEVYKALNQFFFIESDTVNYESVIDDFCEGRTVFTIATTDVLKRLEGAEAEGLPGFAYGIALLPRVSGELESRSMSVTKVAVVNGYSRHKALANRFAAYLAGECAQSLYARTGKVPANLHAEEDNEALQVFRQEYARSIPLPKMMSTGNFWLQLEGLFSKVWNGAEVTELVEELARQIAEQTKGAG